MIVYPVGLFSLKSQCPYKDLEHAFMNPLDYGLMILNAKKDITIKITSTHDSPCNIWKCIIMVFCRFHDQKYYVCVRVEGIFVADPYQP